MIVLFRVAEILSIDKKFLSSCIVWLAWAHQARLAILHHSPSSLDDAKVLQVDGSLVLGESLHKDVCCHIFCRAIHHDDVFISYGLADEVEPNIDMFGAGMVVVFGHEA